MAAQQARKLRRGQHWIRVEILRETASCFIWSQGKEWPDHQLYCLQIQLDAAAHQKHRKDWRGLYRAAQQERATDTARQAGDSVETRDRSREGAGLASEASWKREKNLENGGCGADSEDAWTSEGQGRTGTAKSPRAEGEDFETLARIAAANWAAT